MAKLTISKVSIFNTLGIRELEFDAGAWNEIVGANGQGKTSVLEAIKSVFEGGNDATLIHKGEEKGEVVLVLSDNTTIRRRQGEKSSDVRIERDGQRMNEPQKTINALRDMISVNPVEFLRAPPKRRVDVLLETMPIEADGQRVREIIGDPDFVIKGTGALEQLSLARAEIFAERTGTNRAVKEKEATINQLAETLPSADELGGTSDEADLEAQIAELDQAKDAEDLRIDTKLGELRVAHEGRVDALREEIAALEVQIGEKRSAILADKEAFGETQRRAEAQRTIKAGRWREDRQPLVDQLNLIRGNRDAAVRAATTRATMKKLRAEADELEETAKRETKAIDGLDRYKQELLDSLPIPGLTIADGELYRDGVPFHRLNKQQQAEIAIDIAKLRAGDLGVVCVDELEMLDTEHREALVEYAKTSGLQFFVTRVGDSPLTITSH